MDVQILFRMECGRGGVAGDVTISRRGCTGSTGRRSLPIRLFDVEWGGRQKSSKPGSQEQELRGRIDAMEKIEGVQGGPSIPSKEGTRKMWGEIAWKSRMRPRAARNWMNRGGRCKKELREVDRLFFVPNEMQECIKESLQHQLQDVEKRRNELMPEHQKAQKRSQKI